MSKIQPGPFIQDNNEVANLNHLIELANHIMITFESN